MTNRLHRLLYALIPASANLHIAAAFADEGLLAAVEEVGAIFRQVAHDIGHPRHIDIGQEIKISAA